MSIAGENYWPRYQTPVRGRAAVAVRPKIDRKTLLLLALFLGVPAVLFITLKFAVIEFYAAKRQPSATEQPIVSTPATPDVTAAIGIDPGWAKLDPAYRAYKVSIEDDNSLKLNNRPGRLYGLQVIPRSKICTYANGGRWACGQRAYIALINVIGSTTIDCREKDKGAPIDIDAPRTYICHLPGTDLAELMLREGWGTMQKGVTDPRYIEAAATAHKRQAGMWRPLPSSP